MHTLHKQNPFLEIPLNAKFLICIKKRKEELTKKVLEVREELRIDNNINQLIEFYENVSKK